MVNTMPGWKYGCSAGTDILPVPRGAYRYILHETGYVMHLQAQRMADTVGINGPVRSFSTIASSLISVRFDVYAAVWRCADGTGYGNPIADACFHGGDQRQLLIIYVFTSCA